MRWTGVQNGFVVVPSVSDGMARIPLAERERYTRAVLHKAVSSDCGIPNRCWL